ncbi:DUF362 domain-containing protein, partial [candidate division KSB1 bacterium]|nr:DUF362 domain-containing protein [candidate division KSB1 bacterium]
MSRQSILARFLGRCPETGRIKFFEKTIFFPIVGFFALIWFIIRIIPKPSRLSYPCMKVTFPLASGFVVWITGLFSSIVLFRHAGKYLKQSRIWAGILLLFVAAVVGFFSLLHPQHKVSASIIYIEDPYGANNPIGEAKGINPGRVVWVHNPDATNENCQSTRWGDGYFLDKNCDQDVVDNMLSKALLHLTGAQTEEDAWDAVFRYFNQNRGKGDIGYKTSETIFIKLNAVHAWNCDPDGSIRDDDQYGFVDTSPQAVLSMLRQLVNKAGVPQENIYVADPLTHIFKHCLEKWQADFPDVHYMDRAYPIYGREKLIPNKNTTMYFSDKGTVLSVKSDKYYTEMDSADYLINIPAMKAHGLGGVTFFAKNFFGAHTRSSASHMHNGLHGADDYHKPTRNSYGMYRVMVDLLGHKNLGGKILIYFLDGLWGTSFEHEPPAIFFKPPFNNDWSSSIFLSQDPVALASVCLDILQEEFPKTAEQDGGEGRHWDANFPACDDYLHQAADSTNWPEGLTYDPENDGTP